MKGRAESKGLIYFMRRADGVGPVKIGCTKLPAIRLAAMQVWSPEILEIVATAPGTFGDERRLHRQFAAHRLHGEWFEASPSVLAAVSRAATLGELPPKPAGDRNVRIMAMYNGGETFQAIADEFGVSRQRIEQIVRKEGGAKRGPRKIKRAPVWGKIAEVKSLAASGCTLAEIADAVGDTYQNVVGAVNAEGIKVRRAKRQSSARISKEAFEVAAAYKAGDSTYDIATRFNRKQPEIYRLLRIAGVKPNRMQRSVYALDTDALISEYRQGATIKALAARHERNPQTIKLHLKKAGALRSREESEAIRIAAVCAANARRFAA